MDIEVTVIKIELKLPLTKIQKELNERNENANLEYQNEEINSYISGNNLNSALKECSSKKAKGKEQNICDICKNYFSTKSNLKKHIKVHNEMKRIQM